MSSLIRRFSRIMHVGVVHQIVVHFESLIVDVEAARRSPIAMSLVRCPDLHISVTRNNKNYLETNVGCLINGQLDFHSHANFSARLTLFESVQGSFQTKNIIVTIRDGSISGKVICIGQLDVASHAGDEKVAIQIHFEGDVALVFVNVSAICTTQSDSTTTPEHKRRDRNLSLDDVVGIAAPISPQDKKIMEQRELQQKFNALSAAPLPPSISEDGGGFTCKVCKNTWTGSRTCILCDSYKSERNGIGQHRKSKGRKTNQDSSSQQQQQQQKQQRPSQHHQQRPPTQETKQPQQRRSIAPIVSSERRAKLKHQMEMQHTKKRNSAVRTSNIKREMSQKLVSNVEEKSKRLFGVLGVEENKTNTSTTNGSDANKNGDNVTLPSGWEKAIDPTSKRTYYFHRTQNITSWTIPEAMAKGVTPPNRPLVQNKRTHSPQRKKIETTDWKEAKDPKSGKMYMYNSKGETKWPDNPLATTATTASPTKAAVKHKKEFSSRINVDQASSTSKTTTTKTKSTNPKLVKYFKMLKMGIPLPAVKNKMRQENCSESEIASLSGGNSSKPSNATPQISQGARLHRIAPEQLQKLAKYEKMKKARIPKHAILRTMLNDGVTEKLANAFLGNSGNGSNGGTNTKGTNRNTGPPKKSSGMVKLHWKKMDASQLGNDSIWSPSKMVGIDQNEKSHKIDEKEKNELKKMFTSTKSKNKTNKNKASNNSGATKKSNKPRPVLDPKRSYNVEICLSRFRSFDSYTDVAFALSNMDDKNLRPEVVLLFRSVLPTNEESTKLKQHVEGFNNKHTATEQTDRLATMTKAEKFMYTLSKVKFGSAKAEGMIFIAEMPELMNSVSERVRSVIAACDQVTQCDALVIVLRKILAVGNTMNEGSHVGEAVGFALESLPRLWSTKGQDKKTTVLDFVVRMLLARDPELADTLASELSLVSNAQTTIQSDLLARVLKIETRLKIQMRLALKKNEPYDSDIANNRFGKEIRKWEDRIAQLSSDRDSLVVKSKNLAKYFGENPSSCTPEKVFKVLIEFTKAFSKSVKESVALKNREERIERQAKKAKQKALKRGGKNKSTTPANSERSGSVVGSMSSSPMLAAMQRRRKMVASSSFDDEDDC